MSKKGALSLLFVLALMMAFCGQAFAATTFTVGAAGTNTIATQKAGATNVVLTAFDATNGVAAADAITAFKVENPGTGLGTELAKISIYRDVNEDGKLDADDTLVAGATSTTPANYVAGTGIVLTPTTPEALGNLQTKKYLVVADLSRADGGIVDNHTFGASVSGTATSAAIGVSTQAAVALPIVATHLRFNTAGYNAQVVTGNEILIDGQSLLTAVDDFGNTDVDFTEGVTFSAADYSTLADISGALTAQADAAGATNAKTTGVAMAAGILPANNTAGAAGAMFTLKSTSAGAVTLVATSATKKIQGSVTISNAAYATTTPVVNPARGIEVYDVDHNGKIDHMTIFFDTPVDVNGADIANFTVSGGYTLTGTVVSEFDAGGVGIRNAGEYGVTVTLNEKADVYDTNVKPDLTYNINSAIRSLGVGTPSVQAFGSAQAIEVDKARPVLISALTKDNGIGAGTATNGILDGIVFTFSEPVRNITAGPATSDATAYVGLAIPVAAGMSFNQGSGSSAGAVHTIPVGETTINTGVTPTITYNEDNASARITDYATSATGANSYNSFYALNTEFARMETSIITTDGAPMVVHSVETLDLLKWDPTVDLPAGGVVEGDFVLGTDGRLDAIRVTFSENATAGAFTGVDFYSSVAAFASGLNANGVYIPTAVIGTGTPTLTFTVAETGFTRAADGVGSFGLEVYDTEATPSFRYDPAMPGSSIADGVGNELGAYGPGGLSHAATKDMAAPVIVKIITGDAYADTAYTGDSAFEAAVANGRIDNVKLVFSEKVQTTGGAQNGGTALDNAVGQFTINTLLAGRTKVLTTAALGKPTWTDSDANGDNKTEVVIAFQEVRQGTAGMVNGGDTGAAATVTYVASATSGYNVKDYASEPNMMYTTLPASTDGAAPFIANGIGNAWGAIAFANVLTRDSNTGLPNPPARAAGNASLGDGYLDGFTLKFTETVATVTGSTAAFTTTLTGGGKLTFTGATLTGAGSNTLTLAGTPDKKGSWDTAQTPALKYDGEMAIKDAAGNDVAAFENLASYDNAAPAVVAVNGADGQPTKLNFTFSEPVYAHDADGKSISFNAASVASSALFGYDNLGAGPGSSGFTAAAVTQPTANVLQATLNANMTVVDIENDLVWVKAASIFDDADVVETGLADNTTANAVAGAGIKLWIMDDVIAPWIIGAETIDYNKNGKIDHIKVTFSENIVDASLKGFVSDNAMSNDVSATWKVGGYAGPVRWNLFNGTTNDGKNAAIAAGKPAFAGNNKNDSVLYLELDEELVPVNTLTGIGSTGFKPTVTWGTGADAETLGDARPNLLVTDKNAADVDDALGLEPTNGAVADKVGPAIVGATVSGKVITVLFSEPVKTPADVKYSEYFLVDGASAKIWGLAWTNNSTVQLTMKSDYAFSTGAATTVAINPAAPDLTDLGDTQSTQNPAGLAADVVQGLWVAGSPASNTPYVASAATRGVFSVSNNVWLAAKEISDASPAAGEVVTIKWTYANIDSVDVYVSFNGGETYQIVPGTRVAASAGQTTWTAKLGVTNVKIQSATNGANFAYAVAPVFDGNTQTGNVGAPADLTISDVPGDNGGFVIAKFTVSSDHLTAVNSYQFYREMTEAVNDTTTTSTWVLWATVPAGATDADNKMAVIVPTITNVVSNWAVRASTTKLVSDAVVAAKEATPVADVVYGAEKAAADVVSAISNVVSGASVDNIAPSALSTVTAADNDGAGAGIKVSWVAPEDHGIVGSYTLAGSVNYIYGVDAYEVYRKTVGSNEFVLAGEAVHGSTSFVDNVADGASVYEYMVKAVDSAHAVETLVAGRVMANNGTPDLTGDGVVGLGDLVILGNLWGKKSTDADYVAVIDFNKDGEIGLGDLVLLGNAWSASAKVAKAAEMPNANVAFNMNAEYNAENTSYFVTIDTQDVANVNGVALTLKYDAEKYEFISNSVSGLNDINIVKADQAGIVDIASFYGEKFNGTITLGFKAKGQVAEMNVEMVNAVVTINGVESIANKADVLALKAMPTVYSLNQNFPNPFNPTTTIEYSIPQAGNVDLVIYNVAGQKVRTLVNGTQAANFYKVVWDGKNDNGESVATGMYFYKLVSGNYSKIVKMTLMK